MRKYFPLFSLVLILNLHCSGSFDVGKSQQVISPELIKEYITFLASDELQGRNTPSPELDSASVYIARQFESMGLEKVNGSYFQKIDLGFISLGEKNHLMLIGNGEKTNFSIKDDFVPYENTGNASAEGELVFCGYGIEAPEYDYNDYRDADVRGKIVLILKHEPRENDTSSIFEGTSLTDYSSLETKVNIAVDKGAAAVLVVTDPLNHISLKPVGFPWPSLSKLIPKDALPLSLLQYSHNIPVIQVGESFIKHIFGSVDSLKELQKRIDEEMRGYSSEFADIKVSAGTSTSVRVTPANNVLAFLEGSDPEQKNEILIIGAHYDHSGITRNAAAGQDSILNGADDNASGTAGMMAIAKAFSRLDQRPKRSVLFIAFAGEERGLLGSRYYIRNPKFPLENTVAMLNLDMIGRNDPGKVSIVAHSRSPELKQINEEENSVVGLELIYETPEKFIGGSDHASFIKSGISALFYFSGIHKDYHKVTDETDLINFSKASQISQLAFRTAFRIANDTRRYKVLNKTTPLI
jgi:hypothetical protein